MREDKQSVCDRLTEALQATRYGSHLKRLAYKNDGQHETVTPHYETDDGREYTGNVVGVDCDSGIALIYDVICSIGNYRKG